MVFIGFCDNQTSCCVTTVRFSLACVLTKLYTDNNVLKCYLKCHFEKKKDCAYLEIKNNNKSFNKFNFSSFLLYKIEYYVKCSLKVNSVVVSPRTKS